MSILRSGEMFSNRDVVGGGALLRERARAAGWARWDAPGEAFERPPRPAGELDFLLEEVFERVIGMLKLLYCLLVIEMLLYLQHHNKSIKMRTPVPGGRIMQYQFFVNLFNFRIFGNCRDELENRGCWAGEARPTPPHLPLYHGNSQ
jgi:hypothetical protein